MKNLLLKSMIILKLAYHWIINQGVSLMWIMVSLKNLVYNMVIIKLMELIMDKMLEPMSWDLHKILNIAFWIMELLQILQMI